MKPINRIKLVSGPLLALLIYFFADLVPGKPAVTAMAGIAVWMAVWWLTEVVHMAVTALLPVVLFPLLGIADSKMIAFQYMDPIIFLFIGGFIIAFAIERWQLHQRIALKILMILGTKPSRILLGVMITAYVISMWISNTATVMMLLSAVLAVVYQLEHHLKEEAQRKRIAGALLIGLAYAATIGGMATLVGTPTNMIFLREYQDKFPGNNDVTFLSWFSIGLPLSFALLIAAYFILKWIFIRSRENVLLEKNYFSEAYSRLGRFTYEEKVVGSIFLCTAGLWFTRSDIDFGWMQMRGWSSWFEQKEYLSDSTVAVLMALTLFFIPSRSEPGRALITWNEASKLPLDIILLFGGGFALAKGFEVSGLSSWIASQLSFTSHINVYGFIVIMCIVVTIISEFASNVACIQLMMPVLIALQKDMNVHPLMLMMPATLAASLGFMLPVATAPNTIVFGSNRVRVKDMMVAGILLDVVGILLITLMVMIKYP